VLIPSVHASMSVALLLSVSVADSGLEKKGNSQWIDSLFIYEILSFILFFFA